MVIWSTAVGDNDIGRNSIPHGSRTIHVSTSERRTPDGETSLLLLRNVSKLGVMRFDVDKGCLGDHGIPIPDVTILTLYNA